MRTPRNAFPLRVAPTRVATPTPSPFGRHCLPDEEQRRRTHARSADVCLGRGGGVGGAEGKCARPERTGGGRRVSGAELLLASLGSGRGMTRGTEIGKMNILVPKKIVRKLFVFRFSSGVFRVPFRLHMGKRSSTIFRMNGTSTGCRNLKILPRDAASDDVQWGK